MNGQTKHRYGLTRVWYHKYKFYCIYITYVTFNIHGRWINCSISHTKDVNPDRKCMINKCIMN